jgi:hypothetical protein
MEIPAKMESRLIDSKAKPAVPEATACKVLPCVNSIQKGAICYHEVVAVLRSIHALSIAC